MHPLTEDQYQQVREARAHPTPTLRATCPAMEDILHEPIPVLDQGFVRVIDYMGDDAAVVQGARVSYGRGTKHVSGDRGLIRYLMRHRHTTPFELCDIKLHVRAPVFVTRQWFRHRTASINEYSARYSVLDREFYTPAADDIAAQSTDNRQGRGEAADPAAAQTVIARLRDDAARAYDSYLWMLNETEDGAPADPARDGIARELARITLPVGIYTQFYWKVNLWNLLHFLDLRASPHAQQEIRVYADAILTVVERWVPHVAAAFNDYVRQGAQLSAQQLAVIRSALSGQAPTDPATSGLSGRELRELLTLLPELAPRLARDTVG